MSKKRNRKDLLTLAEWCEGMSRHQLVLASEDDRSKQQVRSLCFKAKRFAQCATALRNAMTASN
jgi:hypothetical protein